MARPHRTRRFEIEASRHSKAPEDRVIGLVRSPRTWPLWQSEIIATEGPERIDVGDVVDGDARLLGFDVTGRSTARAVSPRRVEEDVIVGVRMRITYSVAPATSGSIVTHRMEADLPTGVAGSLLSLLLSWRLRKMQKSLLVALSDQAAQTEGDPS